MRDHKKALTPAQAKQAAAFIKKWGVGLTGGIATGKSTVAGLLRALGFTVIDADQLAREVVTPPSPCLEQIHHIFGGKVLQKDGTLDRKALGHIVFSKPEERKKLEAILHPAITQRLQERVLAELIPLTAKPWFYEASLLLETNSQERFREIWLTCCPETVQIARLQKRSSLSEAEARRILESQLPEDSKKNLASISIDTDCSVEQLAERVKILTEDFSFKLNREQRY